MLGYANVCDIRLWCDLSEFVEKKYVTFVAIVDGKIKHFKKCVRYSKESKALYVNILGTRIFYEDFE